MVNVYIVWVMLLNGEGWILEVCLNLCNFVRVENKFTSGLLQCATIVL